MKTAFYKANAHTIIGNIRQRSNSKSIHLYHPLLYLQENMSLLESIAESLSFIFFWLKEVNSACLFINNIHDFSKLP